MSSAHLMTSYVFPHVDFSLEWMAPAGVHRVELCPFTKCHLSLLPHRDSRGTLVRFQCLVNYPYKQAKCLISLARGLRVRVRVRSGLDTFIMKQGSFFPPIHSQ